MMQEKIINKNVRRSM